MNTDFGKIALEGLTSQDIGFVRAIHRETSGKRGSTMLMQSWN